MRSKWLATIYSIALITQSLHVSVVQAVPVDFSNEMSCTASDCARFAAPQVDDQAPQTAEVFQTCAQKKALKEAQLKEAQLKEAQLKQAQIRAQRTAERRTAQRVGFVASLWATAPLWSQWPTILTPWVLRVLPFLPQSVAGAVGFVPALAGALLVGEVALLSLLELVGSFVNPQDDGRGLESRLSHFLNSMHFFFTYEIYEYNDFLWPTGLTEGWTLSGHSLWHMFLTCSSVLFGTVLLHAPLLYLLEQIAEQAWIAAEEVRRVAAEQARIVASEAQMAVQKRG